MPLAVMDRKPGLSRVICLRRQPGIGQSLFILRSMGSDASPFKHQRRPAQSTQTAGEPRLWCNANLPPDPDRFPGRHGHSPNGCLLSAECPPLGVPQVISLAFWGGFWGGMWALITDRISRALPGWVAGLAFGALVPTSVGWFVVAPIKGQPIATGWDPAQMWVAPVVNGAWGLGTALFYGLLCRWSAGRGRSWLA